MLADPWLGGFSRGDAHPTAVPALRDTRERRRGLTRDATEPVT
jgi:hypothetical protein